MSSREPDGGCDMYDVYKVPMYEITKGKFTKTASHLSHLSSSSLNVTCLLFELGRQPRHVIRLAQWPP
jgi:hypothetical protein